MLSVWDVQGTILIVALWNICSFFIEYTFMSRVYYAIPQLQQQQDNHQPTLRSLTPAVDSPNDDDDDEDDVVNNKEEQGELNELKSSQPQAQGQLRDMHVEGDNMEEKGCVSETVSGVKLWSNSDVWLASLAYAMLYGLSVCSVYIFSLSLSLSIYIYIYIYKRE